MDMQAITLEKATTEILDLISTNNALLSELAGTAGEIDFDILSGDGADKVTPKLLNTAYIKGVEGRARAINKKIQDNIATIGMLSAMITLPDNYFDMSQEKLNYRAKSVHNSFADTYSPSQVSVINVIFQNAGFKAWTKDDGVYLMVNIKNSLIGVGAVDESFSFQLGDTDNVMMGDLKDFAINITMPSVAESYTVTMTMCTPMGPFENSQQLQVRII